MGRTPELEGCQRKMNEIEDVSGGENEFRKGGGGGGEDMISERLRLRKTIFEEGEDSFLL